MRRRRSIRALASVLAFAAVVAACGGDDDTGDGSADGEIAGSIRFTFAPDPAWDWIVDNGILEEMEAESGYRIIQSITWDELGVFSGGHADVVSIGSYESPVIESELGVETATFGKFNRAKDVVIVTTDKDWETFADLPQGCVIGVESFVGGSTIWQALADVGEGREIAEGSADLPMATSDYQVMPDLVLSGEFCAGVIDPTQAIPEFATGAIKTLYDGKSGSQMYAEVYEPGHEGLNSNNFIALLSWYEDHPGEIAFFLEVWQRALDEWAANRDEIIETYPDHFAAEDESQIEFMKDYFTNTFDWFVDSPYLDEAWIEGEAQVTEILRDAELVNEDQEMPVHVCIDPASGEETCRLP